MNDEIKEPIYCALAFGAISIHPKQNYMPCCGIEPAHWIKPVTFNKTPTDLINSKPLKDLRKELMEGSWPLACSNCNKSEGAGVDSMRTIWNKSFADHYPNLTYPKMTDTLDPKDIFYSDFTFSTKCNSKCLTCGPNLSSAWEGEWNTIWKNKYERLEEKIRPEKERLSFQVSDMDEIFDLTSNSKFMSFVGGEPTISDEHLQFLTLLVKSGKSKNINISYVTNLTGITDELIELWKNFYSVRLTLSVDGYGNINEYIRYPFKWSKIESNIRKCFDITREKRLGNGTMLDFGTGLSCTISVFNVNDFPNLLEFWYELIKEYFGELNFEGDGHIFLNRVTFPAYMSPLVLSNIYRKKGIDKIKILREKIIKETEIYPYIVKFTKIIDTIDLYISMMEEPQMYNKEHVDILKHFIIESDKFRNRSINDYLPELWKELDLGSRIFGDSKQR